MNESTATNQHFISNIWDSLLKPHPSITDLVEKKNAEASATLALLMVFIYFIGGITIYLLTSRGIDPSLGFPAIFALISYFIIRSRIYYLGTFILICDFCGAIFLNIISANLDIKVGVLFFIPLALIIGSTLLTAWSISLITVLNFGALLVLSYSGAIQPDNLILLLGLITLFGVIIFFSNNFSKNNESLVATQLNKTIQEESNLKLNFHELVNKLSSELDRKTVHLESVSLAVRTAADTRDLSNLLDTITELIGNKFGYYHVGLFLLDDKNQYLKLASASSKSGKVLAANGYKLKIGREGIVGFAAHQKRSRIAQNVGADSVFLTNPDLKSTRSEAALPLLGHKKLIGVLDIQSENENAFIADDISILETIADQLALSIEYIQLNEQSQIAIKNLELINLENNTKAWRKKLENNEMGFSYSSLGIKPIISEEFLKNQLPVDEKVIDIPIDLRGKIIGRISLSRKSKDLNWTEKEIELGAQIASQVALAIENARLLEESQRHAVNEQIVNELSNRFNSSLDIDTLLKSSVKDLFQIPHVAEVSLLINPIEVSQKLEKNGYHES